MNCRSKLAFSFALALCVVAGGGPVPAVHAQTTQTKEKEASKPGEKGLIDLNSATEKELEELPGIGSALAKKIVAGRPYASVDGLSKAGIPESTVEKIKPLVSAQGDGGGKTKGADTPATAPKGTKSDAVVDLNKATAGELESLPGIGPALAKSIIAARPIKSIDDLGRIKGLGKAKIAAIKDHISIDGVSGKSMELKEGTGTKSSKAKAKPALTGKIDLNTATKEELDALPGIGPVKAQAIIDGRPFKTIEDIKKIKGIKDGEFAKIKDMITVK